MEVCYKVQGMNVVPGFPGIVLNPISFPFNQVSQFPVYHLAIQDLFQNPFLLSIYDLWEQGRKWVLSLYGVFWCRSQFNDIED